MVGLANNLYGTINIWFSKYDIIFINYQKAINIVN